MTDTDLRNWLIEEGGPAVQLRIHAAQPGNIAKECCESAVSELLAMEEVSALLSLLDGCNTNMQDKKTLEHFIHSYRETCIDHFFPQLMDMGFRAGIPAFDEKMQPLRELFAYLLVRDEDFCFHYRIMLHRFFLMAGYAYSEVTASMQHRLDAIYNPAKERIFEIYRDGSVMPKKPKQWTDVGIVKEELDPFSQSAQKPLPTIYDISALAYFQDSKPENRAKIDAIIKYILDPGFQKIREGYGLLWDKEKRIYRACGWSPTLPLCEDKEPSPYFTRTVLDVMSILSKFGAAHKARWIEQCVNHVERYRTQRGTYLFPKEYFGRKYVKKAFINKSNMALKHAEQDKILREVVSTLVIAEIKKCIPEFAG
jgi:hypothetical protein